MRHAKLLVNMARSLADSGACSNASGRSVGPMSTAPCRRPRSSTMRTNVLGAPVRTSRFRLHGCRLAGPGMRSPGSDCKLRKLWGCHSVFLFETISGWSVQDQPGCLTLGWRVYIYIAVSQPGDCEDCSAREGGEGLLQSLRSMYEDDVCMYM